MVLIIFNGIFGNTYCDLCIIFIEVANECTIFFSQKTHSTVIIIILAFMSFLTATFVIESMACANAITNHRKIQRLKSRISVSQDKDSSSSDHDTEVDIVNPCSNDNYINQNDNEHEPLLSDMERVGELEIRRAPEVNSR